jgi:predicted nucleic acid-binding protein
LKAVADTSSLIYPAKIPRFWSLMKQTFDKILIPEAVYREILKGRETGSLDASVVGGRLPKAGLRLGR